MALLETDGTVGHADFILMDEVSEDAFMTNLKLRYQASKIYTYIGETVVSVNPYHTVDIYNDAVVEDYKGRELYERPPHIFALADAAFQNMKWRGRDTCIVISGKTCTSREVIFYKGYWSMCTHYCGLYNFIISTYVHAFVLSLLPIPMHTDTYVHI